MSVELDPERLSAAVALATRAHAGQTRKGTGAPYVCHLLIVSGLVLEHGGDEDQALAALLHDALEDSDDVTPSELEARFGERVARIVSACTDTLPGDSPQQKSPWRARKERYLAHLEHAPADVLLVVACDKLHNLTAFVRDLRLQGRDLLQGFNAGPAEQVWFYEQIGARLGGRVPPALEDQLARATAELKALLG